MNDLISRQAAIDAVNEYLRLSEVSKTVQNMTSIQAILRWLPSAQPQGKWILETYQIRCSNCNKLFSDNLFPSNYCPSCGADMSKVRTNEQRTILCTGR